MKLSTSSSIFFATLALSSSSSTLAAPARDAVDPGLSVSPSSHDIFDSSVHPAVHCSAHKTQAQPTPVEGTSGAIAARSTPDDLVDHLVSTLSTLPIVGPIVAPIVKALLGKASATVGGQNLAETDGVSAHGISTGDMAALQAAIHEITQALNNNTVVSKVPAPSPVKNVASSLPIVAQSDFDPAGGSAAVFAAPGSASAIPSSTPPLVVNDVPSPSSMFPPASAIPPSPVVPVNPPNSPVHFPFKR